MSIKIIITLIMIIAIVVLTIKSWAHHTVVMAGVPIIAALLMGFSVGQINGMIIQGLNSVAMTTGIMLFSLAYFGILHEAGVFNVLVSWVLRHMKNSVLGVMISTAVITCLTQLDGSGATTALCTIPPMRPIYDKMKIRREALVLIESCGSAVLCLVPWAPGMNESSAFAGINVMDLFHWCIPLLVFGIVILFLMCVPLSMYEKRHGAGMTNEEFEKIKEQLKNVELPMGKGVAIFDAMLTLVLLLAMIFKFISPLAGFVAGYVVLAIVNFKNAKAQREYIKRQSPVMLNVAFTMFSVAVLVGINNGTGALTDLANLIANTNPSLARVMPLLMCVFSIPCSMILGATGKASILVPAVIALAAPFGFSPVQIVGAIFATGVVTANINFFSATPYMTLALAGVEMRDNIKYCFPPLYGVSLLMTIFMLITGMMFV